MSCFVKTVSETEENVYKAYVKWLEEAQRVCRLFLDADLSLPRSLELLFQDSKRKVRRKRATK